MNANPTPIETIGRLTEAYVRLLARDLYFWAWPLVNLLNRRRFFEGVQETVRTSAAAAAPIARIRSRKTTNKTETPVAGWAHFIFRERVS